MDRGPRHESVVEEQIRLAQERGDFDNLPGKGKPLPGLDGPDDDLWWVKGYIRREGLSTDALLPVPLQLRKEIERLPATIRDVPTERTARDIVNELNRRILAWLRAPSGPAIRLRPVATEEILREWRAANRATDERSDLPLEQLDPGQVSPEIRRPRWWQRIGRAGGARVRFGRARPGRPERRREP